MKKLKLLPLYLGAIILVAFANPTPPGTVAGIALIVLGELLRLWGCGHLNKNNTLTVTGPFAYVKNPLYVGSILIAVGFCLLANNIYLLAALMLMFCLYYIPFKKTVEANRLRKIFGPAYDDYDAKVPDYYPRLTPYSDKRAPWSFRRMVANSEAFLPLLLAAGVALILLRPQILALFRK